MIGNRFNVGSTCTRILQTFSLRWNMKDNFPVFVRQETSVAARFPRQNIFRILIFIWIALVLSDCGKQSTLKTLPVCFPVHLLDFHLSGIGI